MAPSMQSTVAFTLTQSERREEPTSKALTGLLDELRAAIQDTGFGTTKIEISSLGYGGFGIPLSTGRIGLSVWPDRQSNSSWQIWIRYKRSMLKQLFRISPPTDANEKLQRIEQTVARFLVSKEARQIQWITVKEAHERLPR
jgi:hypothetical protein